jgi:hypothetical protein
MRRRWQGLKLMAAVVVAATGCSSRDIALRPPKHPEEIAVPPLADAKFSKPPLYPEGTLNQGDPSRARAQAGGLNGMPNMSAMNGMGGMGGMGGGMPGANGSLGGMGMGGMGMGR